MGEVQVSPENWNDIILESDGNIRMQYVVYDPDPDVGYGTWGSMYVTLTESDTSGFVDLGFPDDSGGMVVSQAFVGIPN